MDITTAISILGSVQQADASGWFGFAVAALLLTLIGLGTCANQTASQGNKGVGTRLYFDANSCTHVTDPDGDPLEADSGTANAYTEITCSTEVTPPGTERDEEEDDGCLAIDDIITTVGPRKLTSSTISFRYQPGDAVHVAIEAAEATGQPRSFVIVHPVGNALKYEWFDATISQFQPQSITKRGFRTASIRLTPATKSVIEDTPGDLGTGLPT